MSLLEAQKVTRRFGGLTAVSAVDFRLEPGVVASVIGPNGAGKTTFFNLLAGVYEPSEGTLLFQGQALVGLTTHQIVRRGLARTFQNIRLFGPMSVLENLLIGMHTQMKTSVISQWLNTPAARAEEKAAREKCLETLDFVGLKGDAHKAANSLPYGHQRLVEIARALASEPSFMLLDEPFAGIDPLAIADIRDVIGYLKGRGIGILITDHNVRETLDIIDRASIIHAGEVLFEGAPQEIVDNPDVRRVYLGERFS